MNNEALILVNVLSEDAAKVLTFIQTKTKGLKGEEHEILDTCVGNMLAYIIYACTAAYIDICSVEKFENFFV